MLPLVINSINSEPPVELTVGGAVVPLNVPIKVAADEAPSYTLTISLVASVKNSGKVSDIEVAPVGCISHVQLELSP